MRGETIPKQMQMRLRIKTTSRANMINKGKENGEFLSNRKDGMHTVPKKHSIFSRHLNFPKFFQELQKVD